MEGKKNAVTLEKEAIEEALEALEVTSETLTEDEPIEISGGVKMALSDLVDSSPDNAFKDTMRDPPHPSEVTLQPVGDAAIEGLTKWVETTHPVDIVAQALQKVEGGVPVRSLVAAACLAAARSCSLPAMGGHHGGPIHPISGAHGVLRATGILEQQLDGGWASLPAMHLLVLVNKHINAPDGRRWGEEGNVPGGKWLRAGLVELSVPSDLTAEEAGPALLAALQQEDPEEAERCLIAFLGPDAESAYARRGELMNILLRVSNAYNLFDDHYFNFPVYTFMTLDAIGWEFAPVLLRVCVRYLANEIVPPKGPDVEALRLQGDLRPPRSLYGRSSTGWEELTAMVDDNPNLDLATVSHSALPNEERNVAALGDAIGHVDRFVQIPPMIVSAVANGLSLTGAGEALAIGSSELVLRSPVGSPNAHVHFSTGAAARRYLLRLDGVDARQKLLSLLTFVTGPEVLGVDLKEGDQALSPNLFVPSAEELEEKSATTSPAQALLEIERLVAGRRDRGLAAVKPHMQQSRKAFTLAQRKRESEALDTAEMTALTTCVQVYLDSGEAVEALEATLIKTICWDDWSEMHMWKAVGGLCDDFATTAEDRRDLHLLALARGAYTIAGFDDDVFSQVDAVAPSSWQIASL